MSFCFIFTIQLRDRKLLVVPRPMRCLLLMRCVVGLTSFSLLFVSLKFLTYSTSMILYFLYPLFTALGARLFLKENLTCWDISATIISLFGVLLFAFPQIVGGSPSTNDNNDGNHNTIHGIAMGLLQAIFMGGVLIVVRKIGKGLHYLVSPAYYAFFSLALFSLICLVIHFAWGFDTDWSATLVVYLAFSGIFEFLGQMTITIALQY